MAKFNFNTLTREGTDEPFDVTLGDRDYVLHGPKDRDPREIQKFVAAANEGDFAAAMQVMVRDEDVEEFCKNDLPTWQLELFAKAYADHHGLEIEQAGESSASSTS